VLKLYTYFRSSAAFRVRIALHCKQLPYQSVPIHLRRGAGEQFSEAYRERNPAQLVPLLEDGPLRIPQSLAIIEYLEERYPVPALLPADAAARAHVRALALTVACDIHPLNNLRVLRYLKAPLDVADAPRDEWARHWIALGFAAVEHALRTSSSSGRCCYGDVPTLADCCLIPQVFNAQRVGTPMEPYPGIARIFEHCMQLEPFAVAAPAAQPDAE